MVQSQQTLAVYKNTEGNNYRGYKVKDFKGKKTNNQGNRGQIKDFSRRRYLNGLYSRTNSLRKEFI